MNGETALSGAQADHLVELCRVVERLARVIRPAYTPVWLNKPVKLLDDDKPNERIVAGDHRGMTRLDLGPRGPGAA
jgi:hypothetical protein